MTPMNVTCLKAKSRLYRSALAAALLLTSLTFPISQAAAVSAAVKRACINDYFSYCSAYEVGSTKLRQCMRSAGSKLSKPCINALVAAGEVSKTEVSRRAAQAN